MQYSSITAVCSQIHTEHINTQCGLDVQVFLMLNLMNNKIPRFKLFRFVLFLIATYGQHAVSQLRARRHPSSTPF